MAQMLSIAESPETEFPAGDTSEDARNEYFKSLTQSMTLGRRPKSKSANLPVNTSRTPPSVSPRMGRFNMSPIPVVKEPSSMKKTKGRGFSKIAILSSFFESKIAALANSASPKPGFWKMGISKKKQRYWNAGMFCVYILYLWTGPMNSIILMPACFVQLLFAFRWLITPVSMYGNN